MGSSLGYGSVCSSAVHAMVRMLPEVCKPGLANAGAPFRFAEPMRGLLAMRAPTPARARDRTGLAGQGTCRSGCHRE